MSNDLTIEMPEVEEIRPCPYVNTPLSKNEDVSFILKKYDYYSDFILFEEGKPNRCFRFAKLRSEYKDNGENS